MESRIADLLKSIPIFEDLSDEELEAIGPLFTERKCKKGTILFFEGEPGDEFFIIKSGMVKIYRLDEFREIILSMFREGDFFGDMALFRQDMKRTATAEAMEATSLYVLSRSDFASFTETCPKILLVLLETLSERLHKANEQILSLTFLDVRTRIYKTLLRLAEEYGTPYQNRSVINVKLTHQQVAGMVGTVRESVTKAFLELQEEGIISVQNKYIMVKDMQKLRDKI
ncbi:Crp/Fnr family transcriptional regulator [Paenibacillus contaminans]|uniref:Crp/Fnr family transcriptional regulator n=1 Tax=Paenibacillus contaminans TaxID=450362 RepID=A0A329LNY5_9BACL|nr:Crp/Fnr family transcriptional regulator [Paenibacillus contaminans]RAV09419.1 Crp/Fnr family transcriptional regulator [Paenibacillus contaminans]